MLAIADGKLSIIQYLLKNGADTEIVDYRKQKGLTGFSMIIQGTEVIRVFLSSFFHSFNLFNKLNQS